MVGEQRKALPIARIAVGIVSTFGLVWLVVAAYWRATFHVPTGTDLVVYGIVLPVAFIAVTAWLRDRIRAPHRPDSAAAASTAPPQLPNRDMHPDSSIALLDSSVRLPAGDDADMVLDTALDGTTAGLHTGLKRADGSGVFASAVTSISVQSFDDGLLPPGVTADWSDEQRRALLLAADAMDDLLQRHAAAALSDDTRECGIPAFRLHLLLPARWQAIAPQLGAWLDAHVARNRWRPGVEAARVVPVANAVQALSLVDALNLDINRHPSTLRHIVLACESLLDHGTVRMLDSTDRLYGRNHLDGCIPGEGACALLLAHPTEAYAQPAPHLFRVSVADRNAPVDLPDAQQDDMLHRLIEQTVGRPRASDQEAKFGQIVSDTDQRSSWRTELIGALEKWRAATPAAAPDAAPPMLGLANGESRGALALGAIAVAGARHLREHQPVLVISNSDSIARGAMLVGSAPTNEDRNNTARI
ncbi:hypothetical protein [Burkholderia pseudomultivorans]|uniref:Membrane protein n=1 Tax=Burkholderia pseudomultivorans TaxID=1207504 RepID=A0A6P2JGG2_9BURK|nr:hypothetical protein [Burkholderia pseudomultivorans]MDR8726390.1 hypothetical protein [Burkholderia pseudomultivorans]MDR8733614.1 hypothetical protein [Burkholderia pseudomultivorans]MDR8740140.1 hypothetical protein [Burkholderia pseudomultivorans]MDR8752192.1 hypothetical protein [Burkholderia pseudomultivorans]MDR8776587.1 hypothetical protein [Burkholderia pseudomultivorans]